jgi:hypothetical protein
MFCKFLTLPYTGLARFVFIDVLSMPAQFFTRLCFEGRAVGLSYFRRHFALFF